MAAPATPRAGLHLRGRGVILRADFEGTQQDIAPILMAVLDLLRFHTASVESVRSLG